jgi:hypothetical protein
MSNEFLWAKGPVDINDWTAEDGESMNVDFVIFLWDPREGAVLYYSYDTGDAFFEDECSTLTDWLQAAAESEWDGARGWYTIEGFRMIYSCDYWGEHDAEADWHQMRRSSWLEYSELAFTQGGPWFVRLMAKTKLLMPRWWPAP